MRILVVTILVYLTYGAAFCQSDPTSFGIDINYGTPSGLNVGDKAPDFKAKELSGKDIKLSSEYKKNNVVLIFYRGEWCPVCNRYLSNFQDSLALIEGTGAKVYAITPETKENAELMKADVNGTFSIIPDTDESIMNNYKVAFNVTEAYSERINSKLSTDIAWNNNKKEAKLPVPATYIIDRNGVIVYRQFDLNYRNRATIKDIIANLPK